MALPMGSNGIMTAQTPIPALKCLNGLMMTAGSGLMIMRPRSYFFDPSELAAVVTGQWETWDPQPYATLSLQDVLYDPDLNFGEYRRDLVGAAAFDRENGLLYVIERLADEYKSVVHVWLVSSD